MPTKGLATALLIATSTMNVLIVVYQWASIGGLERVMIEAAKAARAVGASLEVWSVRDSLYPEADGVTARGLAPSNPIRRHGYQRWGWRVRLTHEVAAAAGRFDFIIVGHVHLLPSVCEGLMNRGPRRPFCLVWTYGIEVWGDPIRPYLRALAWVDRIVAISQFTASQVKIAVPEQFIDVVPCAVDTDLFVPASDRDSINRDTVLVVGRLNSSERYKGHDTLLRAIPHAEFKLGRPLRLQIVGDGDDRPRLEGLARQARPGRVSEFCGRVSLARLVSAYQHCGVFAMPSRVDRKPGGYWTGEGLGIVYLEAQACGRPVVASTDGGAPETMRPKLTGLVADPRNERAVGEAIATILGSPDLADDMGARGRQSVETDFSVPIFRKRLQYLLHRPDSYHRESTTQRDSRDGQE